jgi:hypothetical protein
MEREPFDLGKGASVSIDGGGIVFAEGGLMERKTLALDPEQTKQLMVFLSYQLQRQILDDVINPRNY